MGCSQSDDADFNNDRIYNMEPRNQENDSEENENDEKFKDFEEIGSNYNNI
jgi:hypothetical protein